MKNPCRHVRRKSPPCWIRFSVEEDLAMNVTRRDKKNELHDWIDAEVPQMIEEKVGK